MMETPAYQDHDYDVSRQPVTHWREYVRIFWEWKWITITTLVMTMTYGLISNAKTVPIYRAVARLQIDMPTARILNNIQAVVDTDTRDFDYLNTQVRVMQSRLLAEGVAKTLELSKNPDFLPGANQQADFAGAVQGCISVQIIRGTRIFDITAEHPDPKLTALLANGVAQEFIKQNMERRLTATMDAIRWLDEQAKSLKKQLQESESAVQDYREKTHNVSLEESYNIVVDKFKSMNSAVGAAKMARLTAEAEWKQVEAQRSAKQDLVLIPAIASDDDVAALRLQLTQKQIAISVLRQRYKEKYPLMAAALGEQMEIESKLKQACDTAADRIKTQYLMAKAKEESLVPLLQEEETQALKLGRSLVEYSALKRNAESDQRLYEVLLTRMKEAGVTGKLEVNNARVIDSAQVPGSPVRPNKTRILMYMLVLGLMGGIGLSYGAHIYDDKIRTYKDIESYLGMPLLCEVPKIEVKDDTQRARVVDLEPQSLAAEAFSNLRATIGAILKGKDAKVLMVTSTAPGEGKSLVSSNMAIAFARDNMRTLLIDADLRHPSLHKDYEMPDENGLTQFMANGCTKEDLIHKSTIANMDIIIAGTISKNPAEALGSTRMRELIDEMCERYDRIVIDTPPVAIVSDAIVLLPRVQGVVFVTHFRKIRRDAVSRAVKKLREMGAPLIGNVLNNIDLKKHGYYYYPYSYSYRYPYYYSHYYTPGKSRRKSDSSGEV